jgi:cytosine/adenosine deaminase-related metal-dependent hydrolase
MRAIGGQVMTDEGPREGVVRLDETGRVTDIELTRDADPDEEGLVIPLPVNAHTHLADQAAREPMEVEGLSVEEAVAPPDGLKHRFLRDSDEATLSASLRAALDEASEAGARRVFDFREQGPQGARLLREAAETVDLDVTVLGRPSSPEAFDDEAAQLADLVDGLGISGLRDQDGEVTQAEAEWCHERDKIVALHLSEDERDDVDTALDLDPDLLVHCTECTREDLKRIAEAGVPVVACPRSNELFGRRAPIGTMLDVGLEVALGTDNAMFFEPDVLAEAAFVAAEYDDVLAKEVVEMACRGPLKREGPGVREGDPVAVYETPSGHRAAIAERRVRFPRRNLDDD